MALEEACERFRRLRRSGHFRHGMGWGWHSEGYKAGCSNPARVAGLKCFSLA